MMVERRGLSFWSGILGVILVLVGSYIGLFVAPPERHMGDVQRILYVHVPTAWNGLLIYFLGFVFAMASLATQKSRWDNAMVGAIETGVVLNALMLMQGMIWARPTWGVWWTWGDVRLVFTFLLFLLFAGVLALRSFVDDVDRRARWTAVATIVAFVDVPLVYFCVRWWRSLHQIQSTPNTVDPMMVLPWRINAFGILFLCLCFIAKRAHLEKRRKQQEQVAPPARMAVTEGS